MRNNSIYLYWIVLRLNETTNIESVAQCMAPGAVKMNHSDCQMQRTQLPDSSKCSLPESITCSSEDHAPSLVLDTN